MDKEQKKEYHKQYRKTHREYYHDKQDEWRQINPELYQSHVAKWNASDGARAATQRRQQKARAFINSIKEHYGCVNPDCKWNGSLDACCLDFHHIDPSTKTFCIGMGTRSIKKTILEARKCVVVCAICHRLVTHGKLDPSQFGKCNIDDTGNLLGENRRNP